ncbi:alpha/beta hydrolase [Egicoccus sp. AB-alg2]|uniref:alpha/beta hydrolase n=1 Tax=Egicoccus sp. AB-alg2 TaxID=3242693 RepID=UPI00359D6D7B
MSGAWRTLTAVVATVAGLWLVLVAAAWSFQRHLIYLPDRGAPQRPPGVEEVTLPTQDGLELAAWWVPADGEPVSVVLAVPGNAGNRGLRLPLATGLAERGHAVLLLEYRGYGGNPGRPDEEGLVTDARAAREHLADREEVADLPVVYLGESIGTGVAAALTALSPPDALVLRSPFPSLATVGRHHYPFLPVRTLLRERFETRSHLGGWAGPTLVVAGEADGIVPPELSDEIATLTEAERLWLPGVDHNDRELLDGGRYLDAVDRFVRDHT